MYGLPVDFDPQIFRGLSLESVTFANYTVIFGFAPSDAFSDGQTISISVTSSIALVTHDLPQPEYVTYPITASTLPSLVAQIIAQVDLDGTGDLVFTFANGSILSIFEDESPYESYSIGVNGRRIVV